MVFESGPAKTRMNGSFKRGLFQLTPDHLVVGFLVLEHQHSQVVVVIGKSHQQCFVQVGPLGPEVLTGRLLGDF